MEEQGQEGKEGTWKEGEKGEKKMKMDLGRDRDKGGTDSETWAWHGEADIVRGGWNACNHSTFLPTMTSCHLPIYMHGMLCGHRHEQLIS